ncbi:DNA polymerase III subunit beta [Thermoclostridium stercorarium subsp. stercorarium DSM 8532]|jgi:DNA polymerase-3 subunit beta|uniref:Beta sliding clamp n=2 Tax=Thermoclostridium stercorarium TaxID=1510 RepID=L7VNB5_THES1|nr:DNA polymerase III subunit beta [Thermoclostridium stercorarium]AGC67038.1 DNA polymerase III subunit beta [Thermoclostridium stercorarium subsp. stercorarium DSM 8532]AGI38123.1 DNA polymerase-3 beta subunit [Thermoclostridium stercorarium subsp. stercorarium DSM 8532]ANW97533.1 DNA polymerase III subunit beta [Thermoclostridium stercorarium subsp. thermolacticum DSM 2910]
MNFSCNKQDLLEAITTVQKAVMSKATLPILEGIYIEAGDSLKLVGNCFDMGIEYYVNADIKEKGSIVLNSKMFSDIIRGLPDSEVFIHEKENYVVVIECSNSYFEIKGLSPEGYPMLPEIEEKDKITVQQSALKDMIRKTIYAISNDEKNKILTGSLMEASDGEITMVSLDGYRLAIAKTFIKEVVSFKAIIPGKNLGEIYKVLEQSDEKVKITLSTNQALFEFENCRIISKLIDGEYMNYRSFIPEKFETQVEVNVKEFTKGIERASVIMSEENKYPVKLIIEGDSMLITSSTKFGISKEQIEVSTNGSNMTIGFNPRFLLDSFRVIEDEKVEIYFSSPVGPCVVKPIESDKFTFMILPVRI